MTTITIAEEEATNDDSVAHEPNAEELIDRLDDEDNDDNDDNARSRSKGRRQSNRLVSTATQTSAYSPHRKDDLMVAVQNAMACHRFPTLSTLLNALVVDTRAPPYVIFKAVMSLFDHFYDQIDVDRFTQMLKKLSKLNINKRLIMLETIALFYRKNNRLAAKKYIEANQTIIKFNIYSSHASIDAYLSGHVCEVEYFEWKESVDENGSYGGDYSTRVLSDKTTLSIYNLVNKNKDCQLDVYVLMAIEMYEHYRQYEDILEMLEIYIKNNSDHLNAYIYMYKFAVTHQQLATGEHELLALRNICRLSPDHKLVLELAKKSELSTTERFSILMEFIDFDANNDDLEAWQQLSHLFSTDLDRKDRNQMKTIWSQSYAYHWVRNYFSVSNVHTFINGDDFQRLIKCKLNILSYLESPSHHCMNELSEILHK